MKTNPPSTTVKSRGYRIQGTSLGALAVKARTLALAALVFLSLFLAFALATPAWKCLPESRDCKSLYVVYDSWHSAIVLRAADISAAVLPEIVDFPGAEFVEFSWGDKDYFPNPNAGVFTALKAAFWSSGSVLHVVGFSTQVKVFYPASTVTEMRLTRSSFDQLISFISKAFSRPDPSVRPQPSAGLFAYSRFYPSTHQFSLLKTCNTWVAEALESAGLPVVPGQVLTAANLDTQVAGLGEVR